MAGGPLHTGVTIEKDVGEGQLTDRSEGREICTLLEESDIRY